MTGPEGIGAAAVAGLLALVLAGCPVGLAMILAGLAGFAALAGIGPALGVLGTATLETATNHAFTLVPLFLLMGNFAAEAGIARDLFRASERLTGRWAGGLPAAGVTASALFSTVSGSSLATASTIARVAWPEMRARGVDPRLAAGSLAAGGTLGIMIPPSIALLLYALITEQSVGEMFLAGILPGLLGLALYLGAILVVARRQGGGRSAETPPPAIGIGHALRLIAPALGLFGLVMGGLYGGVFTPTEAGGAGAALALLVALARGSGVAGVLRAVRATLAATAGIFLILIGAEVFGFVVSASQLAFGAVDLMRAYALEPWQVLAAILAIYVVLGCVMESLAMILLTVPIFYPLIVESGFDPVWFGVIAVVAVELGLITPPVGLNLFMVRSVAPDLPLRTVMAGVLPFVAADLLRLAILAAVPAIALLLPGRL